METQTEWIKSKDAIPSHRMRVQMKCKDGLICTGHFDADGFYGPWIFDQEYCDERFLAGFQGNVIEWRPL